MKKSTGIIFLVAAALAAFVYFYELKHNPPSDTPVQYVEAGVFGVRRRHHRRYARARRDDRALRAPHGRLVHAQPMATRADQSRLTGITSQIASLQTDALSLCPRADHLVRPRPSEHNADNHDEKREQAQTALRRKRFFRDRRFTCCWMTTSKTCR